MIKNKIFNYFFLEFLKIFSLVFLSLSILIWFTQAARLLELVTEYGNSFETYIKYLLLNYPKISEKIILLSFLISIVFIFSKLEDEKEISIFFISGINEIKIIKITIIISLIILIFNFFLSIYFAPLASLKAREILASSKFSLINALVKEKNFNTPLKGLTIYVNTNDNKGNLKGVFVYEKDRTIIAQSGRVISDGKSSYLELINGETFEKNNRNINSVKFESTIFNFNQYETQNINDPKISEKNILWLIEDLQDKKISLKRKKEIRQEINKRLIKPFFIFILCLLGSLCLYKNKTNLDKPKFFKIKIFILGFVLLVINEIMLGFSSAGLIETGIYIFIIIFAVVLEYLIIQNLFNKKII